MVDGKFRVAGRVLRIFELSWIKHFLGLTIGGREAIFEQISCVA